MIRGNQTAIDNYWDNNHRYMPMGALASWYRYAEKYDKPVEWLYFKVREARELHWRRNLHSVPQQRLLNRFFGGGRLQCYSGKHIVWRQWILPADPIYRAKVIDYEVNRKKRDQLRFERHQREGWMPERWGVLREALVQEKEELLNAEAHWWVCMEARKRALRDRHSHRTYVTSTGRVNPALRRYGVEIETLIWQPIHSKYFVIEKDNSIAGYHGGEYISCVFTEEDWVEIFSEVQELQITAHDTCGMHFHTNILKPLHYQRCYQSIRLMSDDDWLTTFGRIPNKYCRREHQEGSRACVAQRNLTTEFRMFATPQTYEGVETAFLWLVNLIEHTQTTLKEEYDYSRSLFTKYPRLPIS
jgi:hypothetical protein